MIIVFGATGFTGKLIVDYLANSKEVSTTFGIAGRNKDKLAEIVNKYPSKAIQAFECSIDDQSSIDAIVKQARVVISAAGPFIKVGTPVVDACVRFGVDYVDTTGEIIWVKQIYRLYHEQAVKNNCFIVPMCGFDSIPADLGVYFLRNRIKDIHGPEAEPTQVKSYVSMKGGISGGTLASGIEMEADEASKNALADLFLLNEQKPKEISKEDQDVKDVTFDERVNAWVGPFMMAGLNTRVVRRSGERYGKGFSYQEYAVAPSEQAAKRLTQTASVETRKMLIQAKKLPQPGEGPSEEVQRNGWFQYLISGLYKSSIHWISVTGGEPGYSETSKMVSEAALTILFSKELLLKRNQGGVLTPAHALGLELITRLDRAGIQFNELARPKIRTKL